VRSRTKADAEWAYAGQIAKRVKPSGRLRCPCKARPATRWNAGRSRTASQVPARARRSALPPSARQINLWGTNERSTYDGRALRPVRSEVPQLQDFSQSPLPDSNRRPLLTMRSDRQPVATGRNGFGLLEPISGLVHLPPVATGCDR
jgi:hypothetical protein